MRNILIVDDDHLIHHMMNSTLKSNGYNVFNAENVDEAVHILQKNHFDVLLTDIVMPGDDGTKLMQYVSEHYPEMHILAMTGGMENAVEDYVNFASLFSEQTLSKPFTKQQLLDTLHQARGQA